MFHTVKDGDFQLLVAALLIEDVINIALMVEPTRWTGDGMRPEMVKYLLGIVSPNYLLYLLCMCF